METTKTYLAIRVILALHIMGIILMAGTTIIDYLTFTMFREFADKGDMQSSFGLLPLMAKYGALVRAGAVIIILTGIVMFILKKGVLWQQMRFRIKMVLVILLSLNGLLTGNKQGIKLREAITANAADFMQHTADIREALDRFYLMQLVLFFLIILISMVKPNVIVYLNK